MNLAKHDPETDMEMNMTPMIDVVFLLIIFFMIITDLTQQDLEELQLPLAVKATEDVPDPDKVRPIINIPHDGRMIVKREEYYNPEKNDGDPDPYLDVKKWLVVVAAQMSTDGIMPDGSGEQVPDDPLLIRADQSTPFKHIQKVMEFCGEKGVQIWKVQLAAGMPEDDKKK
jgi:biopolymer transport protein ExbD